MPSYYNSIVILQYYFTIDFITDNDNDDSVKSHTYCYLYVQ